MDRRRFIGMLGAGTAGLGLPAIRLRSQPQDGPNVLFVIFEDFNDWIGCLGGHPQATTPNIDAFAGSGVLFTNAFCSAPRCNPSRVAMLTGLQPWTTGVYDNPQDWRDMIPEGHPTIPSHFHDNEYYTLKVGKVNHVPWYEDAAWEEDFIEQRPHNMPGHDPYLPYHPFHGQPSNIGPSDTNWGSTDVGVTDMADYKRVIYGRDRLLEGLPEPFFFALGTYKVHYPAIAPREYLERYNLEDIELPPVNEDDLDDIPPPGQELVQEYVLRQTRNHKNYRKAVRAYLATIEFVDAMFGILMDGLESSGHADDTIVVVSADHGYHLGEKTHWRKKTLWQEATEVFLSVRAPGLTQPGGVCSEAVSLIDLYPTLFELCELPPVPAQEGVSLVPQLVDPSTPRDEPALITWLEGNHAVCDERYRYIRYHEGSEELYDHEIDPNEWTNVADDPAYAEIKQALASWLPDE